MSAPPTGSPPRNDATPTSASASAGATATKLNHLQRTSYERADGYAPPTPEDRYEAWILAEAQQLGYELSCRCLDCFRPLTDKISVRHRRGRVCRARAGVVV